MKIYLEKNSFIISLLKNSFINFLIILAFAGFFENSLRIEKTVYAIYAGILITVFYKFIRPLLMIISIIPIIMTFGVFIVIINAFIIEIVSSILSPGFEIASFTSAFFLALFISIFSFLLNSKDREIIIKKY